MLIFFLDSNQITKTTRPHSASELKKNCQPYEGKYSSFSFRYNNAGKGVAEQRFIEGVQEVLI